MHQKILAAFFPNSVLINFIRVFYLNVLGTEYLMSYTMDLLVDNSSL